MRRTIFWTLMTDSQGQKETHKSNWVWYADSTGTKIKWQKEMLGKMWTSKRVPLFKKGIYNTISMGELVKAFGTPDDKKQWCKTLEDIGLAPAQPQNTTASSEENN